MSAARARLDVAAENLANGSTDGFRKSDLHGFLTSSGVELRRSADDAQGGLRRTGRALDLAIVGPGAFAVRTDAGKTVATRNGAFERDRFGRLTDDRGRILVGTRGPVRIPDGAVIDSTGAITCNGKVVNRIALSTGATLHSGFLESSNVDAIGEMIDVLTSQRSFETAQKVLSAIDQTRERASTQVAEIKA